MTNPHLLRQLIVFQLKPLGELPIDLPKAPHVTATGAVLAGVRLVPRAVQRLRRSTRAERAELVDRVDITAVYRDEEDWVRIVPAAQRTFVPALPAAPQGLAP